MLSLAWFSYKPLSYENYKFPLYAEKIGWALSLAPLLAIPITALAKFCLADGTIIQRWMDLFCPDDEWGPALAVHRAEYYPLQIPEARRLVFPAQKQPGNGAFCSGEFAEKRDLLLPSEVTSESQSRKFGILPSFERETAI
ncbi:unnamed protein product [Gongylonema pulchrum]|uniref:Anoctamin n=1 Tax=Gongylonema pulchrum TaxID=637853 RepID=A0A183EGV4_9BILA|nr:unnamed protein product [Gongylonema pulchrum]